MTVRLLLATLVVVSLGLPVPADAQSTIYACLRSNGDVRIVPPGTSCSGNGTLISWTANVDALQAQVNALQAALAGLQTQVDALVAAGAPDDGTAAALVGTWTGTPQSISFVRPAFGRFFTVQGGDPFLQSSFYVTNLCFDGTSGCGTRIIGVNPEYRLARAESDPDAPTTLSLVRDGMTLSGMARQDGVDVARLRGLVLSNNFFLLRACGYYPAGPSGSSLACPAEGPAPGPVVIHQGVGTLNRDRTRLLLTGSSLEPSGEHQVFNLGLTKTQ